MSEVIWDVLGFRRQLKESRQRTGRLEQETAEAAMEVNGKVAVVNYAADRVERAAIRLLQEHDQALRSAAEQRRPR